MKVSAKTIIGALLASTVCFGSIDVAAAAPRKARTHQTTKKSGAAKSAIKLTNRTFIGNIYTQAEIWVELDFINGTQCAIKEMYNQSSTESFTATYKVAGKKLTITCPAGKAIAGEQTTSFTIKGYGTDNCELEWNYSGPRMFEGTLSEEH